MDVAAGRATPPPTLSGQVGEDGEPEQPLSIEARRALVADLWLRGVSLREMARDLKVDRRTIDRDLTEIRHTLQRERVGSLSEKVAASIAMRRGLQKELWSRVMSAPDNAQNVPGMATVILQAQDAIDRLEGIEAPEKVNAQTIVEVQEIVMETLGELGGPAAQQEFLRRLRARTGDTGRNAGLPLPSRVTPAETPAPPVSAEPAHTIEAE